MEEDDEIPSLIEVPFDTNKVVPVTILSGFLGSGKTTLLNYILTSNHGKRIAVIENEFSQGLGIEAMIAKSGVDGENISNFFELNNGCICCTVKDDLLRTLEQLVLHKDKFDYILIETTGMANPGPIITIFWTDEELGSCLRLDGVVCVVDCLNFPTYLQTPDISFDVQQQVCYADRILINKCDMVQPQQIKDVRQTVSSLNYLATVETSSFSKVNLDFVLSTDSYKESDKSALSVQCLPCLDSSVLHKAQRNMTSAALKMPGKFDIKKLEILLDLLLYGNGGDFTSLSKNTLEQYPALLILPKEMKIYRMKGVFHVANNNHLYILQAVYTVFELQESPYQVGDNDDKTDGLSPIVIIGTNLPSTEAFQNLFFSCQCK